MTEGFAAAPDASSARFESKSVGTAPCGDWRSLSSGWRCCSRLDASESGGVCVGACFLTGDAPVTAALLRHEAVHAAQWRRYGVLMPVLYLLAGRDPLRNRFEIAAGLADGNYVPRGADSRG